MWRRDPNLRLQPQSGCVTNYTGWTEGTTLGGGHGGAANPNGVVAGGDHRGLVFWPPGRNPVGVDGHRRSITQGWRCANPGLYCTTPLGLEFSAAFQFTLTPSISQAELADDLFTWQ